MNAQAIPLHEPSFGGNEWNYVKECIDTAWVSSAGRFVDLFEDKLARICGTRHAVALVNGTAALDLSLRLIGVNAGDEVIVPSLTFIATVNAVAYQGASPLFIDSDEDTFGLSPDALRKFLEAETAMAGGSCVRKKSGRRIAACVPMHALGHPTRIEQIIALCAERSIPVIEDAAEALGSLWRGRALGSFGRIGTLSFNGNKIVTTGGGGALVTDDESLARRAKHLSTQAKSDADAFWHDSVGFNHRLPNLNAALGCAQLEKLDELIARKRAIAAEYRRLFRGSPIRLAWEPAEARSNFWLNTIVAPSPEQARRILTALREKGVGARPLWAPAHRQPMYEACARGDLSVTDRLWRTSVSLPSSATLTDAQVALIANTALAAERRAARK